MWGYSFKKNKMELVKINNVLNMSSKEMAELTQTRHDSVMRTIKSLIDNGILTATNCGSYIAGNGQEQPCYLSDKRDSLIIVARLSPEFTAHVVDRWQELEAKQNKVPTTFIEAMELALTQAKQIEQDKPKVQFANIVQSSDALISLKDLAKIISDNVIKIGRNNLMTLLRERKFLNKDNTPSQKSVDNDLMKAVETTYIHKNEVKISITTQITGKGQIYFCNNVRKFLTK